MNKKQKLEFYDRIESSAMPELHKNFVYAVLKEVLQKQKSLQKPRNSKSPKLISLQEWEAARGYVLQVGLLQKWVKEKGFCPILIAGLIEEFRLEMMSKNKQYADFQTAFQTYLNKGYLSKKPHQVLSINSPHRDQSGTAILRRGVDL